MTPRRLGVNAALPREQLIALELRAQRADAAFGHEVRHERDEVLDRYLDGRLADGGCGRRYAHLAREHLKDLVEAPAAATKKDSAAS